MQLSARSVILPVRHMSVNSAGRAGETADSHGQRPCKPATSTFTRPQTSRSTRCADVPRCPESGEPWRTSHYLLRRRVHSDRRDPHPSPPCAGRSPTVPGIGRSRRPPSVVSGAPHGQQRAQRLTALGSGVNHSIQLGVAYMENQCPRMRVRGITASLWPAADCPPADRVFRPYSSGVWLW